MHKRHTHARTHTPTPTHPHTHNARTHTRLTRTHTRLVHESKIHTEFSVTARLLHLALHDRYTTRHNVGKYHPKPAKERTNVRLMGCTSSCAKACGVCAAFQQSFQYAISLERQSGKERKGTPTHSLCTGPRGQQAVGRTCAKCGLGSGSCDSKHHTHSARSPCTRLVPRLRKWQLVCNACIKRPAGCRCEQARPQAFVCSRSSVQSHRAAAAVAAAATGATAAVRRWAHHHKRHCCHGPQGAQECCQRADAPKGVAAGSKDKWAARCRAHDGTCGVYRRQGVSTERAG